MVQQLDLVGFGGCTWHGAFQEACPTQITIAWIARLYRDFIVAGATARPEAGAEAGI